MKRKSWVIALAVFFVAGLCAQAASAYTIDTFRVQFRNHEGKGTFNRISFDIKDDNGNYITTDKLQSLELLDPNGAVVVTSAMTLDGPYREMDGYYNGNNGKWTFGDMYWYSGYYGEFAADLIVGTYTVNLQYDGVLLSKTWDFQGKVFLPYVKSSTIKPRLDGSGNLLVTWSVDSRILSAARLYDKSARVSFDVYNGEKYKLNLYVTSPFHMGAIFVPKSIVSTMTKLGDVYKVLIQLRTNNNCNRSYSARVAVPLTVSAATADEPGVEEVEALDGVSLEEMERGGGRD